MTNTEIPSLDSLKSTSFFLPTDNRIIKSTLFFSYITTWYHLEPQKENVLMFYTVSSIVETLLVRLQEETK